MSKQFTTQYANRADDGAPYVGPTLLADSWADAEVLLQWVCGPNLEPLTLVGEAVDRLDPNVHSDTKIVLRPRW